MPEPLRIETQVNLSALDKPALTCDMVRTSRE